MTVQCHFSWQAQHLVILECYFSWQGQYLVSAAFGDVGVSLLVAGYLVILECHFLWQAQYSVKSGQIARARNAVIFNTKCVAEGKKVSSANGRVQFCNFMVGSWSDHVRIMVGSWSNRPRIGIDASTVLGKFS